MADNPVSANPISDSEEQLRQLLTQSEGAKARGTQLQIARESNRARSQIAVLQAKMQHEAMKQQSQDYAALRESRERMQQEQIAAGQQAQKSEQEHDLKLLDEQAKRADAQQAKALKIRMDMARQELDAQAEMLEKKVQLRQALGNVPAKIAQAQAKRRDLLSGEDAVEARTDLMRSWEQQAEQMRGLSDVIGGETGLVAMSLREALTDLGYESLSGLYAGVDRWIGEITDASGQRSIRTWLDAARGDPDARLETTEVVQILDAMGRGESPEDVLKANGWVRVDRGLDLVPVWRHEATGRELSDMDVPGPNALSPKAWFTMTPLEEKDKYAAAKDMAAVLVGLMSQQHRVRAGGNQLLEQPDWDAVTDYMERLISYQEAMDQGLAAEAEEIKDGMKNSAAYGNPVYAEIVNTLAELIAGEARTIGQAARTGRVLVPSEEGGRIAKIGEEGGGKTTERITAGMNKVYGVLAGLDVAQDALMPESMTSRDLDSVLKHWSDTMADVISTTRQGGLYPMAMLEEAVERLPEHLRSEAFQRVVDRLEEVGGYQGQVKEIDRTLLELTEQKEQADQLEDLLVELAGVRQQQEFYRTYQP